MNEHEQITALEWARTKAKWFFSGMAVVMVGALFFGLQTGQVQCGSKGRNPQDVFFAKQGEAVAVVGGEKIERREFERQFRRIHDNYRNQSPPGTLVDPMQEFQMKAQAISSLISSQLLEQKALEYGIVPSKEKVREQLKLAESQLLPPMVVGADRSILQKIGDNLQEKKRRNQFAMAVSRMTGLSMDDFIKMLELQIIQQEYETVLRDQAEKQVKEDARKKVEELSAKVADGSDFVTLAREESADIETKEVGGRLDLISVAQMINDYGKEYADTLRNTAPGSLSKPIFSETRNGYFLIKLDTFRRAEGPEFEAEKDSVRQKILDKKRADAQADAEADIKVDATEEEIREAYETASLWQIFIPVGSSDQVFSDNFDKLLDEAQIEVNDPEARAGFLWMVREDLPGALASAEEALKVLRDENAAELLEVTDEEEREGLVLTQHLEEAGMLYVLGQLNSLIPDMAETKRMQDFFAANQNNLDAFSSFPEPTEEEIASAEKHRKAALARYEESYKLDPQRPWTPIALGQMVVRLELKDRYPEALSLVKEGLEYASMDAQVHQRAQQVLSSMKGGFDPETQADLVTQADEALNAVATKIADIQKKREEFEKKQQEDLEKMLEMSRPETQAEMTPEPEAPPADAPPAMEINPADVVPAVDAPADEAPAADAPAPAE